MYNLICKHCNSGFTVKFKCQLNKKFCSRNCYHKYGHSDEAKQKMSVKKLGNKFSVGRKNTDVTREKMRISAIKRGAPWMVGRKMLQATKEKISMSKTGDNTFIGFKTPENERYRKHPNYKVWRQKVFKHDCYKCKITNINNKELEAHHLEGFDKNQELRFDENNGVTLTKEIHREFHNKYGYGNNTLEQFNDFKNIMESK